MSDWVRFHRELTRGAKRGMPRATRFVYMELSLEARAKRGYFDIPIGAELLDAVHDLIGGDRREVKRALDDLTEAEMVVVMNDGKRRSVLVVNWEKWNRVDDSTTRVQRYRDRARNADETDVKRVTPLQPVTTVTRVEESREEKSRSEDPPLIPPTGGSAPEVTPKAPRRVKRRPPETGCGPEVLAAWLAEVGLPSADDPRDGALIRRMVEWARSKGEGYVDWRAALVTWRSRETNGSPRGHPGANGRLQKPAAPGQHQWIKPEPIR